jgi:hypothetical protein
LAAGCQEICVVNCLNRTPASLANCSQCAVLCPSCNNLFQQCTVLSNNLLESCFRKCNTFCCTPDRQCNSTCQSECLGTCTDNFSATSKNCGTLFGSCQGDCVTNCQVVSNCVGNKNECQLNCLQQVCEPANANCRSTCDNTASVNLNNCQSYCDQFCNTDNNPLCQQSCADNCIGLAVIRSRAQCTAFGCLATQTQCTQACEQNNCAPATSHQ